MILEEAARLGGLNRAERFARRIGFLMQACS